MSFPDKPPASRASRGPRKPRARVSLKMQAIGFLSRREHSRQELREKLLDSLRRRAREEAALAAASEKAARELADALREQPSNGIDDAFAPPCPAPAVRGLASERATRAPGARARTGANEAGGTAAAANPALDRSGLETLRLASGASLPASLRASIVAVAAAEPASARRTASPRPAPDAGPGPGPGREPLPTSTSTRQPMRAAVDDFDDAASAQTDPACAGRPPVELAGPPAAAPATADLELADPEAAVDQLLDWLVANRYLSETRFVESRVNARSRKQGTLLIKLELSRHGLALEPEQAAALRETEFARAQALWQRKFGELAPDARLRAKQARFLAARGFAADVVRRVVGGEEES